MRPSEENTSVSKIYYCSYVRKWTAPDCSEADYNCTSPGPLFYVPRNQPIKVVWVQNMSSANNWKNQSETNCYNLTNLTEAHIS